MPTQITMPKLGESVTEGTVGRWLKQPGDRFERYEALLEVVTDKVDTEVPAPLAGTLVEILVPEGSTVSVGTPLATVRTDDEAEVPAAGAPPASSPAAARRDGVSHPAAAVPRRSNGGAYVSPVVARLSAEHGVDLSLVTGTGIGGRVTKQDLLAYIEQRERQPAAIPAAHAGGNREVATLPARPRPDDTSPPARAPVSPLEPLALPEDAEVIPVSPMRRAIAEHMVRSVRTAPHVTSFFEVDLSAVTAHRSAQRAAFERQGVNLTFTAYFAQAAASALQQVPLVNAQYSDEGIIQQRRVHLGIAVALDDGLIVPVIRDADEKNLLGLARAVNDLSERARTRRLRPEETQGGTFTITNHGVSGSLFATPIINQPQSAILGVGAIQKRAVVVTQNGQDAIAIRPMCYVSLTIDHRLLDGATADAWLSALKRFLEGYPAA